jgi:hypothetical protein
MITFYEMFQLIENESEKSDLSNASPNLTDKNRKPRAKKLTPTPEPTKKPKTRKLTSTPEPTPELTKKPKTRKLTSTPEPTPELTKKPKTRKLTSTPEPTPELTKKPKTRKLTSTPEPTPELNSEPTPEENSEPTPEENSEPTPEERKKRKRFQQNMIRAMETLQGRHENHLKEGFSFNKALMFSSTYRYYTIMALYELKINFKTRHYEETINNFKILGKYIPEKDEKFMLYIGDMATERTADSPDYEIMVEKPTDILNIKIYVDNKISTGRKRSEFEMSNSLLGELLDVGRRKNLMPLAIRAAHYEGVLTHPSINNKTHTKSFLLRKLNKLIGLVPEGLGNDEEALDFLINIAKKSNFKFFFVKRTDSNKNTLKEPLIQVKINTDNERVADTEFQHGLNQSRKKRKKLRRNPNQENLFDKNESLNWLKINKIIEYWEN